MTDNIVFLVGAARSGTKLVRDILSTHPNINCVPYDINFIWRIRNENHENDELNENHYTKESHKKISNYLQRYHQDGSLLVEKTVSNTIRIPFLLRHYPKAKFIFLYRNGMDVCESVIRQWQRPSDTMYIWNKAKHVPLRVMFSYGLKYIYRNFKKDKNTFYWGVNYPGMHNDLQSHPLEVVVAKQWDYCVSKMLQDRKLISRSSLVEISYEDFVLKPYEVLGDIFSFLGMHLDDQVEMSSIKKDNIGKSSQTLNPMQRGLIANIIRESMNRLNYTI